MTPDQWHRLKSAFDLFRGQVGNDQFDVDLDDLIAHVEGRAASNGMVTVQYPSTPPTGQGRPMPLDNPETIHILHWGSPLCKDRELRSRPTDWPPGHTWVSKSDAQHATCDSCKEAFAQLPNE